MPPGYYDTETDPMWGRNPNRARPAMPAPDPDDTAALAAGAAAAPQSPADKLRASANRIGMPMAALSPEASTMEVGSQQPADSIRVRKLNANYDSHGKPIAPRIGAPGDYSLAQALTPEAIPTLDKVASAGNMVYGRNETTGQDFEYTPRKSVRPDVAIAIIREARRKQAEAEMGKREDKRFGHEVELAKVPGAQRVEEMRLQADLDARNPVLNERVAGMRQDREGRLADQTYERTQRQDELTPGQQRTRHRLEFTIQRGNPEQRRQAQMQLNRLDGIQDFGDASSGYGASTPEDEGRYRKVLGSQAEAVGRTFDTGWYTSGSEKQKQQIAINALRTAAARAQVPPEVVDEIIAEAQSRH